MSQTESKDVAFDKEINERRKVERTKKQKKQQQQNSSVAESVHLMGCLLSLISTNSLCFL